MLTRLRTYPQEKILNVEIIKLTIIMHVQAQSEYVVALISAAILSHFVACSYKSFRWSILIFYNALQYQSL